MELACLASMFMATAISYRHQALLMYLIVVVVNENDDRLRPGRLSRRHPSDCRIVGLINDASLHQGELHADRLRKQKHETKTTIDWAS